MKKIKWANTNGENEQNKQDNIQNYNVPWTHQKAEVIEQSTTLVSKERQCESTVVIAAAGEDEIFTQEDKKNSGEFSVNCESPSVHEWNRIETLRVTDTGHFALTRLSSMDWPGAQDSSGA